MYVWFWMLHIYIFETQEFGHVWARKPNVVKWKWKTMTWMAFWGTYYKMKNLLIKYQLQSKKVILGQSTKRPLNKMLYYRIWFYTLTWQNPWIHKCVYMYVCEFKWRKVKFDISGKKKEGGMCGVLHKHTYIHIYI